MKKIIFLILLICNPFVFGDTNSSSVATAKPKLIGGFSAPIFLKHYDKSTLEDILSNPKVTKVTISYPKHLKGLSDQVANYLISESNHKLQVIATENDPVDTNTVKYRHDAIVIILWFSK